MTWLGITVPPIPCSNLFKTKSSAYLYILKQRYEQWWMWWHHRTRYGNCMRSFMPEIYDVNEFEVREREIFE